MEIGSWLKVNGESIYGCGPAPYGRQEWGYFTKSDEAIYAHRMYPHIGYIAVKDLYDRVENITVLETGEGAQFIDIWWGDHSGNTNKLFFNLKGDKEPRIHFHYPVPDERNTVFKIGLK